MSANFKPALERCSEADLAEAAQLLEKALATPLGPALTIVGLVGSPEERARLHCREGLAMIALAARWIRKLGIRKTCREWGSSYGMKHQAEIDQDTYIANGALIAAALGLGAPVKPCRPGDINARLGICKPRFRLAPISVPTGHRWK